MKQVFVVSGLRLMFSYSLRQAWLLGLLGAGLRLGNMAVCFRFEIGLVLGFYAVTGLSRFKLGQVRLGFVLELQASV